MQEYKPSRVSLGSSTEFQFEPENVAFTLPNWQVWLGTKLGGRKGRFTSSTCELARQVSPAAWRQSSLEELQIQAVGAKNTPRLGSGHPETPDRIQEELVGTGSTCHNLLFILLQFLTELNVLPSEIFLRWFCEWKSPPSVSLFNSIPLSICHIPLFCFCHLSIHLPLQVQLLHLKPPKSQFPTLIKAST